ASILKASTRPWQQWHAVQCRNWEGETVVEERVERKLSAILVADVVGYSRLVGADEEGTLAQLKECRRAVVNPKIDEHRGWCSSRALWTLYVVPLRSSAEWSSAMPRFPRKGGSSFASASMSVISSSMRTTFMVMA